MDSRKRVIDLFAGSGGWDVAVRDHGGEALGVEIMKEAVETRELNGLKTIYSDVWDADELEKYVRWWRNDWTLLASPPCQAFSAAGSGAGRKALDDVLRAIHEGVWRDIDALREFADSLGDERIGLVLTPLHYAIRYRPDYIAFEQVPPVLPIWQACAEMLRGRGYSVWTGNLQAEQFGVPQTRKRAILMATRHGVARPPVPTHSKYYPRNPQKLDPGVQKWVSMAEALDMEGGTLRGNQTWQGIQTASGYQEREVADPAQTLTSNASDYRWQDVQRPSPTVTGGVTDRRRRAVRTRRAPSDRTGAC